MKVSSCLAILCILAVTVSAVEDADVFKKFDELPQPKFRDDLMAFVELEQVPVPDLNTLSTFVPESGPFDNAATTPELVRTIAETPTCTVRGQTIFEIRKMRADAKQIGLAIMYEIQVMEKRKTYVEQMTSFLNDRIRELNKVKVDLAAEQKWIAISNARISELAEREKLVKLQDVMTCIRNQQQKLSGESTSKVATLKTMNAQVQAVTASLNAIRSKINNIANSTNL